MNWLVVFEVIIIILIVWFIVGLLLPFLLLKWYLRSGRIGKTGKLKQIVKKLKKRNKEEALRSVYKYITKNFEGSPHHFDNPNHLLFELRNFTIGQMLTRRVQKKKYLWCYSQVKLMKAMLIATKKFAPKDIKIKWNMSHLGTIHQYAAVKVGNKQYKVDPFYRVFKKV